MALPDEKKNLDDPPVEGPILRWLTDAVLAPGGNAWHPKNRMLELSVTVKVLGLSKHQFCCLRELVGKQYHPGQDEFTITSETFTEVPKSEVHHKISFTCGPTTSDKQASKSHTMTSSEPESHPSNALSLLS